MKDAAYNGSPLDGTTILRFAHAFETGGGMERHLDNLDRVLLERNAMTVLRVHVARGREHLTERVQTIGRGQLVLVPLPLPEGESLQLSSEGGRHSVSLTQRLRNGVLYHPFIWQLFGRHLVRACKIPRRPGQAIGAGRKVSELLQRYRVKLIMLHFFGGADADEIVEVAMQHGIPFALQNHFSNDRFLHLSIRKHAMLASGIAGINGLQVPPYLNGRFCNLSNGIDMAFFRRELAKTPVGLPKDPLILLSARVVQAKGHLDLVRAGGRLQERGLDFAIGFAGRVDSGGFVEELKREICRLGLEGRVRFLGDLDSSALRDWYGAAAVLAFPTYHHEGLGRVAVEAQAMQVPVVAYATGGVPEGLLDGNTGFLATTGDWQSMADKLELLLRQPALRQSMGQAGRRFVEEQFSLEALARRHEAFYSRIIASMAR